MKNSEFAYKTFFAHLPDAVAIVDGGTVVDANEACLKLLKCGRDDVVGKCVLQFVHPADLTMVRERLADRLKDSRFDLVAECTVVRPDRSTVEVEFSLVTDPPGEGSVWMAVFRDISERKFREAELLASEAFFRTVAEKASVGLVLHNLEGDIVYANQFMERLTGYPAVELVGSGYQRLLKAPDMTRLQEALLRSAGGEFVQGIEIDVRASDGSTRSVLVTTAPIDSNSHRRGIVSVVQDINSLKQAKAELARSEKEFQALADALPTAVVMTDQDGHILFFNQEATAITGYMPEELFGRTKIFANADDEETIWRMLDKAAKGEGTRNHQCRFLRKDGTSIWVSLSIEPRMREGHFTGLYAAFADITDYKATEGALKQSEARFRSFMENTTDIITVMDSQGNVLYISPSAERISGFTLEELMGLNVFDFVHPEDIPRCVEALQTLLQNPGKHVNLEARQRNRQGEWVCFEVAGSALLDESGNPVIVLNSRDVSARKRAEEALRESERRFRDLFHNSNDAVFLHGLADDATPTAFTEVNPVACELTGYSRDELLQMSPFDISGLSYDNPASRTVPNLAGEGGARFEWLVRHKDGRHIPVEVSSRYFTLGGKWSVLSIARDITERKRAQEALRASEQRYRGLIESQQDLIVRVDPEGRFTFVNDAYCRLFGKSRDELLGQSYTPLVHPDDVEAAVKAVAGLSESPHRCNVEQRAKTVHGWRWLAWEDCAIMDESGAIVEVQAIGRDITEAKEAVEALRESEAKFRSYVKQSADGLFVVDGEGRYLEVNPAGCLLTGYAEEELLQMAILELVTEEDAEEAIQAFRQLVERGEAKVEGNVRRKDGTTVVVEINAVALGADRYLGLVRDVTERRKAEEAVLKSLSALEKAYALQSEFVRNMTHEVRTPLTGVIGYAQALLEGVTGNVSDEQRRVLKRIVEQAESLLAIVEEVLESATLAAGVQKLDLRTLRMEHVVGDALRLSEAAAKERGVDLTSRVPARLPVVVSDAQKLTRILSNLISNAVKFTFQGSVSVTASRSSDGVDIVVADTGIGIPEDRQEHIFDAFVQLSYPGKHKPVGAGLGLSIVRELVDALGCSLTLSSVPGTGTAFTLHVPLRHQEMK